MKDEPQLQPEPNEPPQLLPEPDMPPGPRTTDVRRSGMPGCGAILGFYFLFALPIVITFVPGLPLWIRFEIVFGIWWLLWAGLLAAFLYRHALIENDPRFNTVRRAFQEVFGGAEVNPAPAVIVMMVAAILFYWVVYALLASPLNRDHGCGGRAGRSLLWGGLWATVYVGPFALVAWLIHLAGV